MSDGGAAPSAETMATPLPRYRAAPSRPLAVLPHSREWGSTGAAYNRPSTSCRPQPSFTFAPWLVNHCRQKSRWAAVWIAASSGRWT